MLQRAGATVEVEDGVAPRSWIQLLSEKEDLELSLRKYDKIVVDVVVSVCRRSHAILKEAPMLREALDQALLKFHVVSGIIVTPVVCNVVVKDLAPLVAIAVNVALVVDVEVGSVVHPSQQL